MKRVVNSILACGMAACLSACATRNVTQTGAVTPATAAGSTTPAAVAAGPRGPGSKTPIASEPDEQSGAPFLARAADVFVYGRARVGTNEGSGFKDIVKRRLANGYYDDALSRTFYMQPEVSFDQDQINILRTFLR